MLVVLALTTTVLVAEVIGGWITGSLALLADAGHMFTDVAGILLAVLAVTFASRPPTPERTFGYYRLEILAAVVNAVLLFGVAVYILWEAWQRWNAPPEVEGGLMLAFAAVGLVANIIGLLVLRDGAKESLNLKGAYLEVWADMLGSLGVIIAAVLIMVTGWRVVDPIVAVLIGLWVLPRTWTLLREAGQVLMQGVPHGLELDEVRTMMLSHPNVIAVHDLHAWALGSKEPILTAHVVLRDGDVDAEQVRLSLAAALEERFNIHHATLQVERTACDAEHVHV